MNNDALTDISHFAVPGFLRRCAAIFYDSLVLCGVLIFAAALVVVPLGWLYGIQIESGSLLYRFYLCTVLFIFFAWFWVHGGQTPGMKAWRIRLIREDGDKIQWRDALIRFLSAIAAWVPCAIGFVWILFDKDKLAWYDRFSRTRLVLTKPDHDL